MNYAVANFLSQTSLRAIFAFSVCLLVAGVSVRSDEGRTSRGSLRTENTRDQDDIGGVTPGREAAALKFVELHHAELLGLLGVLKQSDAVQYRRAIKDIFRVSERLARTKTKVPERYTLELELWKTDSRIDLLVASLAMSNNREKLTGQIRKLLDQRYRTRLEILKLDVEFAQKRLSRAQKLLSTSQQKQDEYTAQMMKKLIKESDNQRGELPKKKKKFAEKKKNSSLSSP